MQRSFFTFNICIVEGKRNIKVILIFYITSLSENCVTDQIKCDFYIREKSVERSQCDFFRLGRKSSLYCLFFLNGIMSLTKVLVFLRISKLNSMHSINFKGCTFIRSQWQIISCPGILNFVGSKIFCIPTSKVSLIQFIRMAKDSNLS